MLGNGVGAEQISYLNALKQWGWPCHFYEPNGDHVDVARHPDLAFWDGRPYWFIPDHLGKERGLSIEEAHGWYGPNGEHWLINTLASTCRLTDSQACQEMLKHHALLYLGTFRVEPERLPYLSIPFAARTTLYEGLLVVHCWHNLADRDLAQRVIVRARDRITRVIVPAYTSAPGDVWDWRRDDRIGPGMRYIPWQQAAGSYGLDLMSELVGEPSGRKIALKAALAILRDAYRKVDGEWTAADVIAADGAPVPYGGYNWFGTPLAVATVLRQDPRNEQARSIWQQLVRTAVTVTDYSWLAPGIKP
jgi:hypothetical protein